MQQTSPGTGQQDREKRSFLLEAFSEAIDPDGFRIEGYEIIRELDRGGMGIVYLAMQKDPEREVALKVMLPKFSGDVQMRERFRREAQSMAGLDHPGILPIYEVGYSGAFPFFSMKLATGGSLAEKLQDSVLSLEDTASLLEKIALALHHAHQRGLLHRDLKPGNFLFDSDEQVFVSDFGVAKIMVDNDVDMTQSLSIVGTPNYLPPEIASGRSKATIAGDIYSLGAVLYECLSGKKTISEQETLTGQLRAIIENPVIPPSRHRSGIPRDLDTICLKALEKDPANRYSSAASFAEDLRRWRNNYPIHARPANPFEIAWRWSKRHRLSSILSAALILVALTSGLFILRQQYLSQKQIRLQLHDSLVSQARAERLLAAPGFRNRSLKLLQEAADLKQSPRITTEALAALVEVDISPHTSSGQPPSGIPWPLPSHSHSGIIRRVDHTDRNWALAFYKNGRAALWKRNESVPTRSWSPLSGSSITADFSPTSSAIIVSGANENLLSFSGANFEQQEQLPITKQADFLKASPNSPLIAFGQADKLKVYSQTQRRILWEKADQRVRCTPAWSADGNYLAVALGDEQSVSVLEASTGSTLLSLQTSSWPETIAFDSELRFLAVGGDNGTVQIFDLITTKIFAELPLAAIGVGFTADDKVFWGIGTNETTHLWDIHAAPGFQEWQNELNPGRRSTVYSGNLSPDGKWLLLTDSLGVEIWSVPGRVRTGSYSARNQRVDAPTTAWWLPGESSQILLQIPGAWEVLAVAEHGGLSLSHQWDGRPPGVTIRRIYPDGSWLVDELDEDGNVMVSKWPDGDPDRSQHPIGSENQHSPGLIARQNGVTAKVLTNQTIQVSGDIPGMEMILTAPRPISIKQIFLVEESKRLLAIGADNRIVEWQLPVLEKNLRKTFDR